MESETPHTAHPDGHVVPASVLTRLLAKYGNKLRLTPPAKISTGIRFGLAGSLMLIAAAAAALEMHSSFQAKEDDRARTDYILATSPQPAALFLQDSPAACLSSVAKAKSLKDALRELLLSSRPIRQQQGQHTSCKLPYLKGPDLSESHMTEAARYRSMVDRADWDCAAGQYPVPHQRDTPACEEDYSGHDPMSPIVAFKGHLAQASGCAEAAEEALRWSEYCSCRKAEIRIPTSNFDFRSQDERVLLAAISGFSDQLAPVFSGVCEPPPNTPLSEEALPWILAAFDAEIIKSFENYLPAYAKKYGLAIAAPSSISEFSETAKEKERARFKFRLYVGIGYILASAIVLAVHKMLEVRARHRLYRKQVMLQSPRSVVLFLRAFSLESKSDLSLSVEQAVLETAGDGVQGIAIDNTRSPGRSAGAVRLSATDDIWKDVVEELADAAALVVLQLSEYTEPLAFETEILLDSAKLDRFGIVVFTGPPLQRKHNANILYDMAWARGFRAPPIQSEDAPFCVFVRGQTLTPHGKWEWIESNNTVDGEEVARFLLGPEGISLIVDALGERGPEAPFSQA